MPDFDGRIIISHSYSRLKSFLLHAEKAALSKGQFLVFNENGSVVTHLLKSKGLSPAPKTNSTSEQQIAILRDYVAAIGLLAEWNKGNALWWATDIASKNRFTSPLPGLLSSLLDCMEAIEGTSADGLFILVQPPWPVVRFLENWAKGKKITLTIFASPWTRIATSLGTRLSAWKFLCKSMLSLMQRLHDVRRHYARKPPVAQPGKSVYLIKSFTYASAFSDDEIYRDPFLGELADFLDRRLGESCEILTVTVVSELHQYCYEQLQSMQEQRVVPLEIFLNYSDIFAGFFRIALTRLFPPFSVPNRLPFAGQDVADLVRSAMADGGWRIDLFQYLHRQAGARISETYPLQGCALTYEGNPWERMFIMGLKEKQAGVPMYGYQHSVIPPAAAGMFLSERELKSGIPKPDFLVTTGAVSAEIIETYGVAGGIQLRTGGTLRYSSLSNITLLPRPENDTSLNLLVALEGVQKVLPLVEYVLQQARMYTSIRFRVRAHPVFPFEKFLKMLNLPDKLPANIEISKGRTVQEDISRNEAVLYWGTTIALEALMMGRPVIHFDMGDRISYDPLFDLQAFKWTINAGENVPPILQEITSLSDEGYGAGQRAGREYVERYFQVSDGQTLASFLPDNVTG